MIESLRKRVFWPPFILLVVAALCSILWSQDFLSAMKATNRWTLDTFGWLFNLTSLIMVLLCLGVYCSPLGGKRIGGKDAKPILTKWRWFSITLCTTIATGILFWGSAEPIYHLHSPPPNSGVEPGSMDAARHALSTLFLHWGFTPYAIYALPAMLFALAYYNHGQPFSLAAPLSPILSARALKRVAPTIDAICLYALASGMAASLGAGIISLSGGLAPTLGSLGNTTLYSLVAIVIVVAFVASSISGLEKGIRILSDINIKIFLFLAAFVAIFGGTLFVAKLGSESAIQYAQDFFPRSFDITPSSWHKEWTVFYWANWMAWAPITTLFLGRLTVGYTVREALRVNLLYPALFSILWMTIFAGTSLYFETTGELPLKSILADEGPEAVIYHIFKKLPFSGFLAALFGITAFLSYVTAADSNTEAMGAISTKGISPDSPSSSKEIKIIWGITIGILSWIMVSLAGIEGVKIMSTLGGFPAMFLLLGISGASVKMILTSLQKK